MAIQLNLIALGSERELRIEILWHPGLQPRHLGTLAARGGAGGVGLVSVGMAGDVARKTVPQQLEQVEALFRLVAVRAAQILIEVGPDFRILEITRVAVEIDETRRDGLLDEVLDPRM